MQFEVHEKSPVLRRIDVTVSGNQIGEEEAKNYSKLRKTSKIPGFRPGKVPTQVLRQMYGQRVREDALQVLAQSCIRDILKQYPETLHLSPWSITQPKTEDGGFSFTLDLELRPSVSITSDTYKGITIERPRVVISDEEVEGRLNALRLEHAVFEPVEDRQTVEQGDFISADIQSDVQALQGTDVSLEVGSGQPLAELDSALVGLTLNEPHTLSLTLPDNFPIAALAGTPASVTVTPRAIRKRTMPALDDDLPKEIGSEAPNLAALREEVRQQLADAQQENTTQITHNQLLAKLRDMFPIPSPEQYVTTRAMQRIENQLNLMQRQGFEISSFEPLVERMLSDITPRIAQQVHNEFVLDAIAEREQIKSGESDLDVHFEKEATRVGLGPEIIRNFYLQTPGARAELLVSLRRERTRDFLLACATVVDTDPAPKAADSEVQTSEV